MAASADIAARGGFTGIPAGTLLDGKYRIRRELGRGGMGVVYLADDEALQRRVAIKGLLPEMAEKAWLCERFKKEAVAMAAVRSENVVQVYSYGEHMGHPYFVMEYVPGFSGADLIERANARGEKLQLDVVLGILAQVCEGLDAIHACGLVHRDVKPKNMLVGPRFTVAISDFGIVETLEERDERRELAGTPLYLAPELISGKPVPERLRYCADIYSLGVSAYEMLCGVVPFDSPGVDLLLQRHVHEEPPPLSTYRSDLPPEIGAVVARALAKDPAERQPSCSDFLKDLREARRQGAPMRTPGSICFLVVDDDRLIQNAFRRGLNIACPEASITCASDGLEGLEMAKALVPELIFIDLNMPEMNGMELVAALRGSEATRDIPLAVISGEMGVEEREILQSMGVEHCLSKPAGLHTLVEIVRSVLSA